MFEDCYYVKNIIVKYFIYSLNEFRSKNTLIIEIIVSGKDTEELCSFHKKINK